MARIDHGQVDIELGGETVTLKPTLGAMQKINRKFGSLLAAAQQVQTMDFEALAFILAAGCGRKSVEQEVFETGVINLIGPAANYIAALMNPSGREPGEGDQGKA